MAHTFQIMHAHVSPTMPAISEDEVIQDIDELPPSHFQKTRPTQPPRRESLLTQSLLSESESHNDQDRDHEPFAARQPSRSSTCSTFSDHSHPFTSDDGLVSPSTRASTPGSPPKSSWFRKRSVKEPSAESTPLARSRTPSVGTPHVIHQSPGTPEPTVEAKLGRKRCITFACGKQDMPKPKEVEAAPAPKEEEKKEEPAPAKKACTIKFACAFTKSSSKNLDKKAAPQVGRQGSPAPLATSSKASSPTATRRSHRDSDTTIKNESPKSVRKSPLHLRRPSNDAELRKSEATRFHEFASSDDESQDWMQERTVYKSRLTVSDTLKKETEIRNLHEKADEEALEEEQEKAELELLEDDDEDDEDEDDLSDLTDDGFQTDDEDGFAQSDDEDDDNSDYEWWAPRGRTTDRSPAPASMLPLPVVHPSISGRSGSISSARSASSNISPAAITRRRRSTQPVKIRPSSPELPDSTDFVCGTLDEDRPLEQAFMNNLIQRKAAKHRPTPQDIDPTFPASDPELDEEDDDDVVDAAADSAVDQSDANNYIQGGFENIHGDPAPQRRRPSPAPAPLKRINSNRPSPPRHKSPAPLKRVNSSRLSPPRHKSPAPLRRVTSNRQNSPKRLKSPAPPQRTNTYKVGGSPKRRLSPAPTNMTNTRGRSPAPKRGRSPAPKALFDTMSRRLLSPPPEHRPTSPPPSRRGSETVSPNVVAIPFGTAFLGHRPQLTHTSSLPRHGHGFARRMASLSANRKEKRRTPAAPVKDDAIFEEDEDEDEGETTARDDVDGPYTRGAIDIVQGLERKRLRRRQKFMEKYQRKEDKKRARGEAKRPKPGQGAQRMRQIGLDCAVYRGKRVLSV